MVISKLFDDEVLLSSEVSLKKFSSLSADESFFISASIARNFYRDSFLDFGVTSVAKTKKYFSSAELDPDRVFFIAYFKGISIAHIGVKKISDSWLMLDNALRISPSGPKDTIKLMIDYFYTVIRRSEFFKTVVVIDRSNKSILRHYANYDFDTFSEPIYEKYGLSKESVIFAELRQKFE
jgi:hypothetical protein